MLEAFWRCPGVSRYPARTHPVLAFFAPVFRLFLRKEKSAREELSEISNERVLSATE